MQTPYTLNLGGRLFTLNRPVVMGILNITPDSFYAGSRMLADEGTTAPDETAAAEHLTDEERIRRRVHEILDEGGEMIDVGAYSTRPGAPEVTADEEMRRLAFGLDIIRREAPDAIVSVDTFRADVAKSCVRDFGVQIINDISGGELDRAMFHTVGRLGVPYILMHMQGEPRTMQDAPHYDNVTAEVITYLARRAQMLRDHGVKDIILDPGFGFGKTLDHNYELMAHLADFHELQLPLLVGISRKSMIYRLVGGTPIDALNGTTALNMAALMRGAHILRVHDVKQAVETVKIYEKIR
ncbi:MAG: dihydropteroate synthase [Bacteroidales bacterium]|nr:dihydropteroate synthase [Bacteroidales bacterium]